ncbi:GNAT family N-acetyltransferase [Bowmanella pacifica]|uniref:BioF2-like acetyltransferase domain-containing protein n=1 Tax=Bowmanella pacifica TaxID=502051 RepID=A0A917YQ56_9ALTE|nr:GNAT family N-acetyltransferase [Bowmanella pacifica]GGO63764.1 hypothetical protein GCM10010982_01560 [Bowmanella pacifica]
MSLSQHCIEWQVMPLDAYPGKLWDDWHRLNLQFHRGNMMLGASFCQLLVKYFATEVSLAVAWQSNNSNALPVSADGKSMQCEASQGARIPVALALLESNGSGRWSIFKPSQAQVALILADPNIALSMQSLVDAIPGSVARLDFLGLDPLEHPGLITQLSPELQASATDIRVELSGSFSDYWAQRPKNLRKNISRYFNRVERELGQVRLVFNTEPPEVYRATSRYGMLESQGWKGYEGTALHPSNEQGQFYQEFMAMQAGDGAKAFVAETYVADRLVASRLCCIGVDTLVILKTTYDESMKKYAFGRLQLHSLIEHCFTMKGLRYIDFYTNASPEQLEWSTDSRQMLNASYYSSAALGQVYQWAVKLKKRMNGRALDEQR